MKSIISTLFIVLVLGLIGCRDWFPPIDPNNPKNPKDTVTHRDSTVVVDSTLNLLVGKKWCLVSIEKGGTFLPVGDPGKSRYIIFDANGGVTGSSYYNDFTANYKAANGAMSITNFGATKRLGDAVETDFFQILRNTTSYSVEATGLRLISSGGTLHFELCDPNTLGVRTVQLNQNFEEKIGDIVEIAGEGLQVETISVPTDSRCPSDVQCVWAGDATVMLKFTKGSSTATAELHTNAASGANLSNQASFLNYDIKLVSLLPYPIFTIVLTQSDYVPMLVVTKH